MCIGKHLDFILFFQLILFAQFAFKNTLEFLSLFTSSNVYVFMLYDFSFSLRSFSLSLSLLFFILQIHFIPVSERETRDGDGNRKKKKTSFVMSSFDEYLSPVVGDGVFSSVSVSLDSCIL
jgi:hypothetical protein